MRRIVSPKTFARVVGGLQPKYHRYVWLKVDGRRASHHSTVEGALSQAKANLRVWPWLQGRFSIGV